MTDGADTIEILIRGMNAGASLLLAGAFLAHRPLNVRRILGALFSVSAAAYVLISAPAAAAALGWIAAPAQMLAIYAPIIFWWFALALFDDGFKWRWPLVLPLALGAPFVAFHFAGVGGPAAVAAFVLFRLTQLFAYLHAIYVALKFVQDDLLEGRRRFRVVFAVAVAITGLVIVYTETVLGVEPPEGPLMRIHAAAIFALTLGFGLWLLGARADVIDGAPPIFLPGSAPSPGALVRAADRPAYEKLLELMEAGAWREEGLSVSGLAAKVGVPEHQLRRLINGELGFRNFSAFLNERRIAAAKAALADPAQARRQILQIALDAGYGSIAPFNRAFREATGMAPTEFRKAALGEG